MIKKIFYFPLTRIILGIFVWFIFASLPFLLEKAFEAIGMAKGGLGTDIANLLPLPMIIAAYIVLFKYYERREVTELSFDRFLPNAFLGTLIGGGLQSLVILSLFLLGMYSIVTVHGIAAMIPGLIVALASGVTEEILFRGIIFRITEEKLGSVYALAITAAMFGLIHLGNPNATLWSAFAIAVEAGIMLAAAYMLTRSLWLPIFIHISWNFAESGIFGTALSGMDLPSTFFSAKVLGPPLVTGGAFGPENSVIALGACSIAGAIFLYKARQKNMFIQPFWKAKKLATRVEA